MYLVDILGGMAVLTSRKIAKTTTTEALLGMLTLGPMSGYELRQRIEMSIGNFWSESFGQIYPALQKLRRQGLVEVEETGRSGRKVYSLTPAGRDRLAAWLRVMPSVRKPRNEMLLKLFFGANGCLRDAREQVRAERSRFLADLERYRLMEPVLGARSAGRPGLPFYWMTLRYGIAEAEAVIVWADETLRSLDEIEMGHEERR